MHLRNLRITQSPTKLVIHHMILRKLLKSDPVSQFHSYLLQLLLDLGGTDDQGPADGVLHGLDAGVDVVDGESVVPLLLIHLEGSCGDLAAQNNTGQRLVTWPDGGK